ncbi:MAG: terminase [Acidobacteria bacterium]|nr:terminase [Acidobacteriota bacterium]
MERLLRLGIEMERVPASSIPIAADLLRVRGRDGRLHPLAANAAQRRFEERRRRHNVVLKARQMGMTTWVAGRFFLRTITRPGTVTLQVAHTREAAEAIFGIVQRMWEELPEELRAGPLERSRANAGLMVFPKLRSEYRVASASDTSAGRGLSVQHLHCSEVSRWPGDAAMTLAGLRAALAPDGELVMESTPNGAYGAFYEEWCAGSDGVQAESDLVRHFLPWWMEPAYVGRCVSDTAMTDVESALVAKHGLSGEQIGFRRELERRYGGLRTQEFAEDAETCFRATGSCFFDVGAIERQMMEVFDARRVRRGGALLVWFEPQAGRRYIVAVDSAGGGEEGDFAAVQVIDRETGLQCAELQERLRPAELAKVSVELAKEYGEAMIVVERNNHGAAVLAYVETSGRYGNLYRQSGEAGWLTTAVSKPEMTARMGTLLEQRPETFKSRRLLGECRTFVGRERGKTGAANGAHDDLVMAMAIAQSVRAEMMTRSYGLRQIR